MSTTVKLVNGTKNNSVVGQLVRVDPSDPKKYVLVDFNNLPVIGTIAESRSPGNPTTINLLNYIASIHWNSVTGKPSTIAGYNITDHEHFGDNVDYSEFEANGHLFMVGDARPYRDEIGDSLGLQSSGPGVSLNLAECTQDFAFNAAYNANVALADLLYKNVQLNHDKDLDSVLLPHIHWFQAKNYSPNLLLEYRWQVNLGAKTTAWTKLKCNNLASLYGGGTIHQISYTDPISVPVGTGLSDIVQFRIYRDTTNASTEFTGTCPYNTGGNASVGVLAFDCHFMLNSLGSDEEYIK